MARRRPSPRRRGPAACRRRGHRDPCARVTPRPMAVCAHARYLLRMFSSLPAPRAAAAASLYPAGAVVPPSFPALLPKPKPRQRKPPSKMQRPQQPLAPLVATHPQAGNRTLTSHLPGLGRALDTETLAEIRRSLSAAPEAAAPAAPAAGAAAGAAGAAGEGGAAGAAAASGAPAARPRPRLTLRALRAQRQLHPPATVAAPSTNVFAVLAVAGKQYKVSPGDIINAERLKGVRVGEALSIAPMVVGSRDRTLLGRPTVPRAAVRLVVREHVQDIKVVVFKKKRRKRYQKKQGHRREVTRLFVEAVDCSLEEY